MVVLMVMVNGTIHIMSLITFKHASEFCNNSTLPFGDRCTLVRMTVCPRNFPVIHEAPNDGVASPNWQTRVQATPTQEYRYSATHRRKITNRRIWHLTQVFPLIFKQKVYLLCGRVWWIFLISLFSVLGSKQHIPFHSLQCFINNKIASICLSCKYLDSGSCW